MREVRKAVSGVPEMPRRDRGRIAGSANPHSGIATLTYVAEGEISYIDPDNVRGTLPAGGVEWMQAGRGMWHGGGLDKAGRTRGFQLWIALPPKLELGPTEDRRALAIRASGGPHHPVGGDRIRRSFDARGTAARGACGIRARDRRGRIQGLADTEFVLGSAARTSMVSVLGDYSVHTSPEALRNGEARILSIAKRLTREGRLD